MYAAKRKFHHLLDSLSGEGPASAKGGETHDAAATMPVESGSQPKHRRGPSYRPRPALQGSTHPEVVRPSSTRTVQKSRTSPTSSLVSFKTGEMPNYAPWSREQFLDRLKTFRDVGSWSPKPDRVNEVQWAKRGWQCVGRECVGCVGGCERHVCIKLGASEHQGKGEEGDEADEEQTRFAQEAGKIM